MNDDQNNDTETMRVALARTTIVLEGVVKGFDELKTDIKKLDLTARLPVIESDVNTLKRIVYGACGFILLAVLGALVYLVVRQNQ